MLKLPLINLVIKFREKDLTLDEILKDFIEEKKVKIIVLFVIVIMYIKRQLFIRFLNILL